MAKPLVDIWYWVRGSSCSDVFSVEASSDTLLKVVRQRIKESWAENSGSPVSDEPRLYKVPEVHPVDIKNDGFVEVLGALSISRLGPFVRVSRMATLESIFKEGIPDHRLHIIVDFPTYPIACWIRGGSPESRMSVKLAGNVMLDSALKSSAKEAWPLLLQDVPTADLVLNSISFKDNNELEEILGGTSEGDSILEDSVDDTFRNIPFSIRVLKVVVGVNTNLRITNSPSSRPGGSATGNNVPTPTVAGERSKFLNKNKKRKPSSTAAPSTFLRLQNNTNQVVPCGRPRDHEDRIPLSLLHPVFAQFKEDVRNIRLEPDNTEFIVGFADAMSKIYQNESFRVGEITNALKTYDIHLNISKTRAGGYESDGDMSTRGFRYVIAEYKNEVGCVAKEPYFQSIAYYLEFTRAEAVRMSHSPLPCLLISIYGAKIDFYGAAWNLRPVAQSLATVAFDVNSRDIADLLNLARHMRAFRNATETLKTYYETLESLSPAMLLSPQLFPHPTMYTSRITQREVEIVYKRQISDTQLVFFGFEGSDEGPPICIKFVRRYSAEAHEHCTTLECAPRLRGFETLVGNWFMVVMDDISNDYETLFDTLVPESVKEVMKAKLLQFHDAGFVHGDLRNTNIMACKSNAKDVKFIDFDWAGKVNKTSYPPFVNRDFWRPAEAKDFRPILAKHDIEMLDHVEWAVAEQ